MHNERNRPNGCGLRGQQVHSGLETAPRLRPSKILAIFRGSSELSAARSSPIRRSGATSRGIY